MLRIPSSIGLYLCHAAVNEQFDTRDVAAVVRRKENSCFAQIVQLQQAWVSDVLLRRKPRTEHLKVCSDSAPVPDPS
jgi:hypothetical protein